MTTKAKKILILSSVFALMLGLIVFGLFALKNDEYYLVSLLLIALSFIPFFVCFENRVPRARELVLLAMMIALSCVSRMAFYMLPQFKPILAMVIITGIAFGGEAGFICGACSGFISNFFFGQGPWTPYQMFALGIIGFLAGVLFKLKFMKKKVIPICIFGGISAILIYGVIVDTASLFMFPGKIALQALLTLYATGLPFNVIHGLSTIVFLALLTKPMLKMLDRIKTKYGLFM